MEISLAARSSLAALRLLRINRWAGARMLGAIIQYSRFVGPALPSRRLRTLCAVQEDTVHGERLFYLSPKTDKAPPFHLFYLHGGAFSLDISLVHWHFIEEIVRLTGCTVTVPLYPLAPEHDCALILQSVIAHYRDLAAHTPSDKIVVMGDSAGGGLSLSLAQAVREHGLPMPGRLALLSPWLDLTMSHPVTRAGADRDPILTIDSALAAAHLYAGNMPLDDPRLSPLLGPLDGLPPMIVMTGTADILNAEARRLQCQLEDLRQPVEMLEYPDMIHAWMLLPIPEAKAARAALSAILMRHFEAPSPTALQSVKRQA